jgi:hypothetical protein
MLIGDGKRGKVVNLNNRKGYSDYFSGKELVNVVSIF